MEKYGKDTTKRKGFQRNDCTPQVRPSTFYLIAGLRLIPNVYLFVTGLRRLPEFARYKAKKYPGQLVPRSYNISPRRQELPVKVVKKLEINNKEQMSLPIIVC